MPPRVLGVLNVTPDSVSDGGLFIDPETAVARADVMLDEGADMIDVGGASTRPGAAPIGVDVEIGRVVPVLEALAGRCRLSIDTNRAEVASAAIEAGATIINDVGAELWPVAAAHNVGWIATHMQDRPATMQDDPRYDDVVAEVTAFLDQRATEASAAGVEEIWIDPGFGFGKTLDQNLALLADVDRLVATGWPVAVGTSRKSMLGELIGRSDGTDAPAPTEDRLVGSVVTSTYAMAFGADLIRVHDVKAARQAATVTAGDQVSRRS